MDLALEASCRSWFSVLLLRATRQATQHPDPKEGRVHQWFLKSGLVLEAQL